MSTRDLSVRPESWPLAQTFRISRGEKNAAEVVVVEIAESGHVGRGECVPYARYGETVAGTIAEIEALQNDIEEGASRGDLQRLIGAGAARSAIDCALWDLESKISGKPVWALAGLPRPGPVTTAFTLSLDTPEMMATRAKSSLWPILKLKLGGPDDVECVRAVREASPHAMLIVDPNEGWTIDVLARNAPELAKVGVRLIEQPLPAANDAALERYDSPVPLCADESVHTAEDVGPARSRYSAINVKIDKAGGLTASIAMLREAQALGMAVMVGSQVGTSLAMAPAALLAPLAQFVDLDGALLLARDRKPGLQYKGSTMFPREAALWG